MTSEVTKFIDRVIKDVAEQRGIILPNDDPLVIITLINGHLISELMERLRHHTEKDLHAQIANIVEAELPDLISKSAEAGLKQFQQLLKQDREKQSAILGKQVEKIERRASEVLENLTVGAQNLKTGVWVAVGMGGIFTLSNIAAPLIQRSLGWN
jgi:hypothetical protein